MPRVLSAAEGAYAAVRKYEDSIDKAYFGCDEVFSRYKAAQAQKDWGEADLVFLNGLERNPAKYQSVLDAESTMRAFSAWLCGTALASDHAYRWIDPPELHGCVGGTFESRIETDGTRRGFKALTANPGLWLNRRKVQMRAPIDGSLRRRIRCVRYTALPRQIRNMNERIGDPKSAKYAAEAEMRVPDGTPIPPKTVLVVLQGAGIDGDVAKALGARHKIVWLNG